MDNNVEERAGWGMGKSSVEVKRGGKGNGSRITAKKERSSRCVEEQPWRGREGGRCAKEV